MLDRVGLKISEPSETLLPDLTVTAFNDDSVFVLFISTNVKQANHSVQRIKAGDHDLELSKELGKACSSALTFSLLLQIRMIIILRRSKEKKTRPSVNRDIMGK